MKDDKNITYIQRKNNEEEINSILNPIVLKWFKQKFGSFTESQRYSLVQIYRRKNILLSSPTGSGKTLSAFASILSYLINLSEKNELEDKVYVVYTSPLKALARDIEVNLKTPLEEMEKIAGKKFGIRIGLRTGDTTTTERQKMVKKSPHILITTPESLAIMLISKKFCEKLKAVEFVIVDELHALANKRGVHLSLSLELLQKISKITPVRIGLSATISPLEEMAKFLIGSSDECLIADVNFEKKLDIEVLSPVENLVETDGAEMHFSLYKVMDKLIQDHKTTLIFTNTRSATERVVHHLKEMFPEKYIENIGAHHSSLGKDLREIIEEKLRKGDLKVVVTSTSLELGIDIGYIDLVILLGSPKSIARAIQRCGRAGHKLDETAKGRFLVLDRDDLIECCVMKKEILERKIDKIQIPKNCLDVLSQMIYCFAIHKVWDVNEMFEVIKGSYCYRELSREDFLSVLSYLRGDYELEARNVYGKIWYDEKTKQIGKKGKLARMILMTNIGTIPEEAFVNVIVARGERKGHKVGAVDEAFVERLKPGDVFVLGGEKYGFLYTRGMNIYVNASVKRPPTIPNWFSEMLPLSFDMALEISRFRELVKDKIKAGKPEEEIKEFIERWLGVSKKVVNEIYNYIKIQQDYIGIPSLKEIIIENYKGEKNYFIFHTLYGRRVNDALSRTIGFLVGRQGARDVEIGINDNGFLLCGENIDKQKIEKAIKFLNSNNIEEVLKEAIEKTEILKRRFRHCATRALMILRNYKGKTKSVGRQQVSSNLLFSSIKRISDEFPILKEAKREVLEDVMDIENAKKVIDLIKDDKINVKYVRTDLPSPFSLNLISQAHQDYIKIESKIEFLKRVYKALREKQFKNERL
ncbi:MAG: ATP-dependent helicase [Candidatus Pacearchaeota archaeon]